MKYVKIFGERHTGTNALRKVILRNSASEVLRSNPDELMPMLDKRLVNATHHSAIYREAVLDNIFARFGPREAWKHCATHFDSTEDFADTLVLFLVRHPVSWVLSFHRDPWHNTTATVATLEEFIDIDWRTVERERLDRRSFKPLDLLVEKIRSYRAFSFRLKQSGIPHAFVRFEDFVVDQPGEFAKFSRSLEGVSPEFTALEEDAKAARGRSRSYYADYYGNERWRAAVAGLEPTLNSRVNWKAFSAFGYVPL